MKDNFKLQKLDKEEISISIDLCTEKLIADDYCCIKCYNISMTSLKCKNCNSMLCMKCLKVFKTSDDKCPCCKKILILKNLDRTTIIKIHTFNVNCPNKCSEDPIKLKNMYNHLSTCKYTKRTATCLWCKETFTTTNELNEINTHVRECRIMIVGKIKEAEEYFVKGNLSYYENDYLKAIECYDKAIDLNKDGAKYYNMKGMSLYDMCKFSEAVIYFSKAVHMNPKEAKYYVNLGEYLL
jgi:hypothetical protein